MLRISIVHPQCIQRHWRLRMDLPVHTAYFYGFRPKTVRSWDGNRMFLVRKPYGFGTVGTENVKRRLLETETKAFHPTLIHSLLNKVTGKLNMNIRILP